MDTENKLVGTATSSQLASLIDSPVSFFTVTPMLAATDRISIDRAGEHIEVLVSTADVVPFGTILIVVSRP